MAVSFVRQLGAESGVQLAPLRDQSEMPTFDQSDQVFGIVMRCLRGRIDKPFKVHSGNFYQKLGKGEQMRVSALNEAYVQVFEALNNGAYEAVVQRLVNREQAKVKWAVCKVVGGNETLETLPPAFDKDTPVLKLDGSPLTGAKMKLPDGITPEHALAAHKRPKAGKFLFEVSEDEPTAPFVFAVKHLECFNDGIKIAFHAEEIRDGGVEIDNDIITFTLSDCDGHVLHEFTGSLNPDARDDFGNTFFLPDVIAAQTDALEVKIGGKHLCIPPHSDAYGFDDFGTVKWARSGVLQCFDEGRKTYSVSDYQFARLKLQKTTYNYAYIASGGTRAPALLAQLAQLAFQTNRQLRFDVPGELSPQAAIAFVEQLNMGSRPTAHLMQAFWAPFKSLDPTGLNPKGYFGTAALNIAMACLRNAQTDAKGFAPKNYPIAGREWPVARMGMSQNGELDSQEFSALARAKINPVVFETFTGGGRFVFKDSITCALVENSLIKLISVADMSTSIDDAVTRAAKDYLQLPMDICVKRLDSFLLKLFEGAEAAKWIVPSKAPEMGGKSHRFLVRPNAAKPYDCVDVSYWVRYDGVARQIFVTQTISR